MVKILIVDDDVVSRMVLMHLIDGAGGGPYELVEAEDGEDAWRRIEADAPDMVFCDLRMPHLSGMELLARVKADARHATLPFVLASAAGDAATMEQALGLGADAYIVKPFDAARVAGELTRLLARDEAPETTARRLGIDVARLGMYFGGLQRQLITASTDAGALPASGQGDAMRATLGRLGEGCRTLGLATVAVELAALAGTSDTVAPPDAGAVTAALARALAAVEDRLVALRHGA
jgi:two-component system chemotaxis response regulator CheY